MHSSPSLFRGWPLGAVELSVLVSLLALSVLETLVVAEAEAAVVVEEEDDVSPPLSGSEAGQPASAQDSPRREARRLETSFMLCTTIVHQSPKFKLIADASVHTSFALNTGRISCLGAGLTYDFRGGSRTKKQTLT